MVEFYSGTKYFILLPKTLTHESQWKLLCGHTVCICWHERQLCSQCAVRQATGMLVAAIYSAGGNTENMKGCQVSVFC